MVAGACGDHQERQVALRRHRRHEGLGAVASRDAEQVGARVGGPAGERRHVLPACHVQDADLGAERLGLLPQPETADLAAARARVHDQVGVPRWWQCALRGPCRGGLSACQRDPAAEDGQGPQRERDEHHPQQPGCHVEHDDGGGGGEGQHRGQRSDQAGVDQCPPHSRRGHRQPGCPHEEKQQAVESGEQQQHDDRPDARGHSHACGPAWSEHGTATGHVDLPQTRLARSMPPRLPPDRHHPLRGILRTERPSHRPSGPRACGQVCGPVRWWHARRSEVVRPRQDVRWRAGSTPCAGPSARVLRISASGKQPSTSGTPWPLRPAASEAPLHPAARRPDDHPSRVRRSAAGPALMKVQDTTLRKGT